VASVMVGRGLDHMEVEYEALHDWVHERLAAAGKAHE
jgi:hypothetical protein